MNKIYKQSALLSAVVGFCSISGVASADFIDFQSLPAGYAVTNQYADVSFSLAGGNASGAPEIAYYTGAYGGGGLSNSPDAGNYPTADELVATFATPVSGLQFLFDNEGYNGGNAYYVYSGATLIASGALDQYGYPGQFFDLSALSGVTSVVWSNGENGSGGNWTQALGSISYTPGTSTPGPASPLVFALGGWGLARLRRLRK